MRPARRLIELLRRLDETVSEAARRGPAPPVTVLDVLRPVEPISG